MNDSADLNATNQIIKDGESTQCDHPVEEESNPNKSGESLDITADPCDVSLETVKKHVSRIYVEARKENVPVDPETQVYPLFEEALAEIPWNIQLWNEYIISMERNKCDVSRIVLVFEKALTVSFNRGQDFRDLWLVYIDCLRRHTDWSDEKQVASLDKTFDVCTQYLGRIPDSDPELSVLKYWALIQGKHLGNINAARELWDGIASQQGLRHSSTSKFWIEYLEFERLYGEGDDDTYRDLLHRALQQTYDHPEIIAERLIKFERQEGERIETLVDAESKCKRILAKAEKIRREREAALAEKRSHSQLSNDGQTKRSKRKRKKATQKIDPEGSGRSQNEAEPTQDEAQVKRLKPTDQVTDNSDGPEESIYQVIQPVEPERKFMNAMLPRSVAIKKKT
ncbi:Squamous cell carcinoma antigen recognized by T-cells 3, partial [Fragariocoptes setiger]